MPRYPELDFLRTLAILLMVAYHAAFDLSQFYGWDIDVFGGPWLVLARATAILFLLVSGASAAISFERMKAMPPRARVRRHLLRFARIGGAALLVTAATYAVNPETYVRFGILHLIAVTGLLLPLAVAFKERAALAGIAMIAIGLFLLRLRTDISLLIPFGLRPADFQTVDYFPLLPWAGVILIGYAIGYTAYVRGFGLWARSQHNPLISHDSRLTTLLFPSRHALLLYLLHQPLIMAVLWLLLGRPSF